MKAVTEDRKLERLPREQVLRNTNNERKFDAGNRRAGLIPKAARVFRTLKLEMARTPDGTVL